MIARLRGPRLMAIVSAAAVSTLLGACASPVADEPSDEPSTAVDDAPAEVDTSTLRSIIDSPGDEPVLQVLDPAESLGGETAVAVSYESGGLTITGVLRTPDGDGPFPAVVVVHGAVNPSGYESGGDLVPEQRALLESGYAVLATDLRGYAGSDDADAANNVSIDPGFGWVTVLDWGMALDVVNALRVLRGGQVESVDPDRIGLLGHSLGGLLAIDAAVIAPGSSDLVVALAAPTIDLAAAVDSRLEPGTEQYAEIEQSVGTPDANPEYWADVSPITFLDRATEPLLLIHGSVDDVAPAQWAEETAAAWDDAGNASEVIILEGADHLLSPLRADSVATTIAAFDFALGPGGQG